MKLVYICSPLRADSAEEMEQNRKNANDYCQRAMTMGFFAGGSVVPISPINNFSYLDESKPEDRQKALNMGLSLLEKCSELWVVGDRISEGMKGELRAVVRMDIPILSMGMESEKIVAAIGELSPLLSYENCVKDSNRADYKGKLLILKPEALADWCKEPESQLWVCSHGNGANPNARGQSVFVQNLMDGEKGRWDRHHFLGIADLDKLPDWAAEKWNEMQHQNENEGTEEEYEN